MEAGPAPEAAHDVSTWGHDAVDSTSVANLAQMFVVALLLLHRRVAHPVSFAIATLVSAWLVLLLLDVIS